MKISAITFTVLLLFQLAVAQNVNNVDTGTLTITITDLENDVGEVLLALSNSRENYESGSKAYLGFKVNIMDGKAECTINDLPFGEYAIKLYHDENMDGELIQTFSGFLQKITASPIMLPALLVQLIMMMPNFSLSSQI